MHTFTCACPSPSAFLLSTLPFQRATVFFKDMTRNKDNKFKIKKEEWIFIIFLYMASSLFYSSLIIQLKESNKATLSSTD